MIEFKPFYQFGYFLPHDIKPEPNVIKKLLDVFEGWDFIPNTNHSLGNIQIGQAITLQAQEQLQLSSMNGVWLIVFEPARILIQKINNEKIKLGTIEEFSKEIKEIIQLLKEIILLKANRLSFVTKSLCNIMEEDILTRFHE